MTERWLAPQVLGAGQHCIGARAAQVEHEEVGLAVWGAGLTHTQRVQHAISGACGVYHVHRAASDELAQ